MEWDYSGETLVDSSVFLNVLKHESLEGPCSEFLEKLKVRNRRVCVTPIIMKEITEKMDSFIKENTNKKSYRIANDEKNYIEMWTEFLTNFNNLLTNDAKILYPLKNFEEIFKKCYSRLRAGERDKINLALTISNNCDEFVTCDHVIGEDKITLEDISNLSLTITLIDG